MLSSLPNLAPRDSYALWYTSSHQSNDSHASNESAQPYDSSAPTGAQNASSQPHRRSQHGRSPLAQLRADEQYMERRKLNVQNYGSSWIKPPGVFKSLHQIREEAKELREHQEALRREELLAQELAEAEAAQQRLEGGEEMEEARDLDDDVPEADETALDPDSSDSDLSDIEETSAMGLPRIPEDAYRDALMRGEDVGGPSFGAEGNGASDEEDGSQMLQEEDLTHDETLGMDADLDLDMDMNGDLDGDVPEAEGGGYEHTDTEAELSSSEEESSIQEDSSDVD